MRDGWEETTIGSVAAINPEPVADARADREVRYVDLSAVSPEAGIDPAAVATVRLRDAPGRARRVIRAEDVLVATVRPYLRGFALVGSAFDGAIVSTGFAVLRARRRLVLPDYLWATVRTDAFADGLMARATGSNYPAVRPEDVAAQPIVLPPLAEQRRIVDLIAAVDAAVASAQRYAGHARLVRSMLLAELVGKDNDHVARTALGKIAEFQNGYPFKPRDLGTEGLPVIRIKQLLDPAAPPDRSTVNVDPRHRIDDGDLIFSWSGTLAVRVWDRGPALLNQHLFRVVERHGVDRRWLRFALDYATRALADKTHGTTMKHITKAELLPHPVGVPLIADQQRIADTLEAAEANCAAADRFASMGRSVRSALLADLLSGDHAIPSSYDRFLDVAA